jgi:hypothetical protein
MGTNFLFMPETALRLLLPGRLAQAKKPQLFSSLLAMLPESVAVVGARRYSKRGHMKRKRRDMSSPIYVIRYKEK